MVSQSFQHHCWGDGVYGVAFRFEVCDKLINGTCHCVGSGRQVYFYLISFNAIPYKNTHTNTNCTQTVRVCLENSNTSRE